MSFRRHLPRIVLVVAAAASIATSSTSWFIEKTAPLTQVNLDDRMPMTVLAIQATIDTGEDEPESRGGEVQVAIDLADRSTGGGLSAEVDVELRSVARGEEIDHQVLTVPPEGRASGRLTLLAWPECTTRTCTEDFTLTVRRLSAQGPTIEISGVVYTDFSADGASEPPRGAGIMLGVTNIGPVP